MESNLTMLDSFRGVTSGVIRVALDRQIHMSRKLQKDIVFMDKSRGHMSC